MHQGKRDRNSQLVAALHEKNEQRQRRSCASAPSRGGVDRGLCRRRVATLMQSLSFVFCVVFFFVRSLGDEDSRFLQCCAGAEGARRISVGELGEEIDRELEFDDDAFGSFDLAAADDDDAQTTAAPALGRSGICFDTTSASEATRGPAPHPGQPAPA